jgi:hypothetical protein
MGRGCPQQGCSSVGVNAGGVGSQAPDPGVGTYGQLLTADYPSLAAHARMASATAWLWATERR